MNLERSLGRRVAVAIALLLLTGCASSPPTPITSVEPLVGKWAGNLDQGGPREFFYLTVNPDQTFVASWGINWCNGRITLANGKASYQMTPPPLEGTLQLYAGDGKPTIYLQDTWQSFRAIVTKQ
jgi:hypothetical protein